MKNENDETSSPESGVSQAKLLADAGIAPRIEDYGHPDDLDFPLGEPHCGIDGPCEGCQ